MNYVSLKDLSRDDRPREKLVEKGQSTLSNAEILGILIGAGTIEKSAVQLCREIMQSVNNDLSKLAKLSVHDLMKFKGIGMAKAVTIIAALELGRRRVTEGEKMVKYIRSSKDVYTSIKGLFQDLEHEEFYIVLLNRGNQIKSIELISKGGFSGTAVDGKIVFKKALEQSASALVLCHNHPSGSRFPSKSDLELTKNLKKFGAFIELPVLDHLIVTKDGYYSFSDEGVL